MTRQAEQVARRVRSSLTRCDQKAVPTSLVVGLRGLEPTDLLLISQARIPSTRSLWHMNHPYCSEKLPKTPHQSIGCTMPHAVQVRKPVPVLTMVRSWGQQPSFNSVRLVRVMFDSEASLKAPG